MIHVCVIAQLPINVRPPAFNVRTTGHCTVVKVTCRNTRDPRRQTCDRSGRGLADDIARAHLSAPVIAPTFHTAAAHQRASMIIAQAKTGDACRETGHVMRSSMGIGAAIPQSAIFIVPPAFDAACVC
jgi:hypothetical protein